MLCHFRKRYFPVLFFLFFVIFNPLINTRHVLEICSLLFYIQLFSKRLDVAFKRNYKKEKIKNQRTIKGERQVGGCRRAAVGQGAVFYLPVSGFYQLMSKLINMNNCPLYLLMFLHFLKKAERALLKRHISSKETERERDSTG